jgi:hypothetical protein
MDPAQQALIATTDIGNGDRPGRALNFVSRLRWVSVRSIAVIQ